MRFFTCILFAISQCHRLLASNFLEEREIHEIYHSYVLAYQTAENKNRYMPLPLEKNTLPWRWEGKDFPRIIALLEFERFVKENKIESKKALSISGIADPEWYYLPHQHVLHIDYAEDRQYDLHRLNLSSKDYDFVMINQTLEHVYDPITCLKNLYKHMQPGGILFANVPSNNILHSQPNHYFTGYTPVGLGCMLKMAGFKILHIGQWGNLEYLHKMQSTNSWPDFRQFYNPGLNDWNHPVITWIFAIK